jgi:hypothetical protein
LYLIDPNDVDIPGDRRVEVIKEKASGGVKVLRRRLLESIK